METTRYDTIFDFIKVQETMYKRPIPITDGWDWNMYDHIKTSVAYNNSQLLNGKNEFTPVKNITRPILNLQHRAEDIDVKDVQIYVNDPSKYHLSFLVKKYHDDVFVKENDIDTFFDELNVSRIDFGAGLSKKLNKPAPEVVPLQSLVFCDQTDILSGPIGIKHFYSPDQLLDMADKGWGNEANGATISLEELIRLSRDEKKNDKDGRTADTPGRYIEIYEVHGNLPKRFADKGDESGKYETRLFICAFYQKKGTMEKDGVILYTAIENESIFKLIKRDPVYGRALGFGGAEELFEAQVWTNYDQIRIQDMLDAASKTLLISNDPAIAKRNNVRDLPNLSVLEEAVNGNTRQLDTFPRNMALFEKSKQDWEAHAQQMGAANDSIMGESPSAGTPFKLQELVTRESHSLHEYRRGQYAKHLEEIYQDWIIPHIQKKITEGAKFLSELSVEDMKYVTDRIKENAWNRHAVERVLNGEMIEQGEKEVFMQGIEEDFRKKGNKHFIEILKGEFKNCPLGVSVNIAGKQKNLAGAVDKIVNIFRFAFSNPQGFAQVMQIPGMSKSFNEILEFSGLSPADFSGIDKLALPQPEQAPQQQPQLTPQNAQ